MVILWYVRHRRDKIQLLSYCYTKMHQVQLDLVRVSCLDRGDGKIHSCALGHSEVTWCAHKSLAAVHQPLDNMYFQTELFGTANREGL
jgi:hypothetical protein